ncbi:hypothetical protein ACQBAR_15910 [Propionibacteriaceae bacterium Y1685]
MRAITHRDPGSLMKFDAMSDAEVRDWCMSLIPPGTAWTYLSHQARQIGLLKVAQVAFPDLPHFDDRADVEHHLLELNVRDTFPSNHPRSAEVDLMVAEFIATCWRARAELSQPDLEVDVRIIDDHGPTVTMTLSTAQSTSRAKRASALPPFYRWEMPDLGVVSFDPSLDPEYDGSSAASISTAAAVTHAAFPELIEVDDHILIKDQYNEKTFNDWLPSLQGDRGAAERTVNHFVVWSYLDGSAQDDAADEQAAEFIALCWRYWFHDQYPDRRFQVSIIDQYGPTVTVFELRD